TRGGLIVSHTSNQDRLTDASFDDLINRDDVSGYLRRQVSAGAPLGGFSLADAQLLPPIGSQEVWAAGVTYYRSRDAPMEEAHDSGGGSFYDRVYTADRPQLLFKATPHRVAGPG